MTDTLKPCPFCGGRPVLVPTYHEQFAFIKCLSCAMETNSYGSVHDAYKAWNTRASTPAPAPQEAIDKLNAGIQASASSHDPYVTLAARVMDAISILRTPAPAPQEAMGGERQDITRAFDAIDLALRDSRCAFGILKTGKPEDACDHLLYKNCDRALSNLDYLRAALTSQAPAAMREGVLVKRADGIKDWLYESGSTCFKDQKHLEDGTPEREYWHYGYMMALIDLLRVGEG